MPYAVTRRKSLQTFPELSLWYGVRAAVLCLTL